MPTVIIIIIIFITLISRVIFFFLLAPALCVCGLYGFGSIWSNVFGGFGSFLNPFPFSPRLSVQLSQKEPTEFEMIKSAPV